MATYPDVEDRFDPDLESLPDDRAAEACFDYDFPVRYMSFWCSADAAHEITEFEMTTLRADIKLGNDEFKFESLRSGPAAIAFARISMNVSRLTRLVDERFVESYLDAVHAAMARHPVDEAELKTCKDFAANRDR